MLRLVGLIAVGVVLSASAAAQTRRASDWILDPDTQCRIWNPAPQDDEQARWSGACVEGHAEGLGELRWFIGETLQSTDTQFMRRGKPHGVVNARGENGAHTQLTYENGVVHGPATTRLPSGDIELWTYVNGLVEGVMLSIYVNGDRLEEDFRDDKEVGTARMRWVDGSAYSGGWADGRPHGIGTYRDIDGQVRFEGQWTRGCFSNGDQRHAIGATKKDCGFE